jgi:hypothetical protein
MRIWRLLLVMAVQNARKCGCEHFRPLLEA